MDKTVAGLIGAVTALAAAAPAHAGGAAPSVQDTMQVDSYADLLRPIPNAAAVLQQADAEDAAMMRDGQAMIEKAQYYYHHHHHHHRYYYRRYHHHHHHHHHHRYYYRPY